MFNEVVNEGIDQACICDPKRCMVITKNLIFIHGHSHANQQYFFWILKWPIEGWSNLLIAKHFYTDLHGNLFNLFILSFSH